MRKTIRNNQNRDYTHSRHEAAEKRKAGLPPKRQRQYQHILESEKEQGRNTKSAKRIAMATVNKTRNEKGETKESQDRN